ncbi:hypothetical protein MIB92_14260 [Aestuariirhabdus sp. Z084]|uniref:hypothetical protein n=1 Tax=Aestuariirhabdus haliotis TaxID=2918751 RepID=UPI00201B3B87|nr:hypothetical protein [Aestuariirhabdus haliotis]MCL6416820.1 hypothetical protein [Aestuariirhabdus haliotis]MCL6420820.1 hypothetical protein [Aestuariirhabdus haliotis]
MKTGRNLSLLFLLVFLTGCVSNYQYRAFGTITTSDNQQRNAVLYWNKDEGRLWYLKKYEQVDTSVTLRVCQGTPKIFSLDAASGRLILPSKANDLLVTRLDSRGRLTPVEPAKRLQEGQGCGLIRVDKTAVSADQLNRGRQPEILIFCRNPTRPDRYPQAGTFTFESITAKEYDSEQRPAPDPCNDAGV